MRTSLKLRHLAAGGVFFVTMLPWANAVSAQEITRGSIIATTCYTCHGTKGVSPGAIPGINDISPERLVRTLKEFREGTRASTVMGRHASGYTDDEIADVAQFFGNLQKQGK